MKRLIRKLPRLVAGYGLNWPMAIRLEVLKWGVFLSMVLFTITLVDRHAEVLIGTSFLLWIFVAWRSRQEGQAAI